MRSMIAFVKKEALEHLRSVRLLIIGIVFMVLGVSNPIFAKLTPWLFELLEDSLADGGMSVTGVTVSAIDSWVQFFKNIPIGLILLIILECNVFTKEYSSGTLILSLTKGLERYKVVISKALMLSVIWTVVYWISFILTYSINSVFWDNSVAQNLFFSILLWWIFGIWVISLAILFSTIFASSTMVLVGCGGSVLLSYLLAMLPKINKYLPTFITEGNALIYGVRSPEEYISATVIVLIEAAVFIYLSVPIFNKKQL